MILGQCLSSTASLARHNSPCARGAGTGGGNGASGQKDSERSGPNLGSLALQDSPGSTHSPAKAASEDGGSREEAGGSRGEYWDEEDELEEYVMRADLGQLDSDEDANDEGASRDGPRAKRGKRQRKGSNEAGSDDDEEEEGAGPLDPKQLNADTQRILRGGLAGNYGCRGAPMLPYRCMAYAVCNGSAAGGMRSSGLGPAWVLCFILCGSGKAVQLV